MGIIITWDQVQEFKERRHQEIMSVRNSERDYNDNAILYRTNAQSRLFEEKFIAANIPYKIVGGVNFYARREIKDLLAYLKTIENGVDDLAVQRIINVPRRGIGQTTILKVQSYADSHENNLAPPVLVSKVLFCSSLKINSLSNIDLLIG